MWKRSLIKNKIFAGVIFVFGFMPVIIEGNGTFLPLTLLLSVALFFAKKNYICGFEKEDDY